MGNTEAVEIWVPYGQLPGRAQVSASIAGALVNAFCKGQLATYCKHRWTGADEAISDLALLDVVHGLLRPTYILWAQSMGKVPRPIVIDGDVVMPLAEEMPHDDSAAPARGAAEGAPVPREENQGPADPDNLADDESEWEKRQAGHRREATRWLDTHTSFRGRAAFCDLVLLRMCTSPLQEVLHKLLFLASHSWELAERAKAAKALRSGKAGDRLLRDFRVLVAARGTYEGLALNKCRALLHTPTLWHLLPGDEGTNRRKVTAFAMISNAAAGIEKMLAAPHRRHPFRLFRLLETPEVAQSSFWTSNDVAWALSLWILSRRTISHQRRPI